MRRSRADALVRLCCTPAQDDNDEDTALEDGMAVGLPPGIEVVGHHPTYGPIVSVNGQLVPLMLLMPTPGDDDQLMPGGDEGGDINNAIADDYDDGDSDDDEGGDADCSSHGDGDDGSDDDVVSQ